jgi:hypothetical protein
VNKNKGTNIVTSTQQPVTTIKNEANPQFLFLGA